MNAVAMPVSVTLAFVMIVSVASMYLMRAWHHHYYEDRPVRRSVKRRPAGEHNILQPRIIVLEYRCRAGYGRLIQ